MSDQCASCQNLIAQEHRAENSYEGYCSRECAAENEIQKDIGVIQQKIDAAKARNAEPNNPEFAKKIQEVERQLSVAEEEQNITTKLNILIGILHTAKQL